MWALLSVLQQTGDSGGMEMWISFFVTDLYFTDNLPPFTLFNFEEEYRTILNEQLSIVHKINVIND